MRVDRFYSRHPATWQLATWFGTRLRLPWDIFGRRMRRYQRGYQPCQLSLSPRLFISLLGPVIRPRTNLIFQHFSPSFFDFFWSETSLAAVEQIGLDATKKCNASPFSHFNRQLKRKSGRIVSILSVAYIFFSRGRRKLAWTRRKSEPLPLLRLQPKRKSETIPLLRLQPTVEKKE